MKSCFFLITTVLIIFETSCGQQIKKTGSEVQQAVVADTTVSVTITSGELKSNHIPDSIFQMRNLKQLTITGMDCDYGDTENCREITEIPPQIKNLQKLEMLRLNVNAISSIPAELAGLKNLMILDLSDNIPLKDIGHITSLENLHELYIFGCRMEKLPEDIGKLKNLKSLGLTGNHIDQHEIDRLKKALPGCKIIYQQNH